MKIKKYTRKSHYFNEDRYIINKDFIMVIDGATSLEKSNLKPTSGAYLAGYIKTTLPKIKGNIIERLNIVSKNIYRTLETNNNINEKILPSCGMAWVEFYGDKIIIHTIGDCEAFVVKKDNATARIVIDDLLKLDDISLDELKKTSKEKNISIRDARPLINETLIKHRLLMNKEGGYSVFTPSNNPNFKYSTHEYNVSEVKDIYLYSDGFADAFTTFKLFKSAEHLFSKNRNIKKIINKIAKKASEDKNYNKYPRFKIIDDITIVKISL